MVEEPASGGVSDLLDRIGRMMRGLQFVEGLSPAQWEALRYIARANRYSRNPSALADFLGTSKGTVSQTLIALEGKGYLRRVRGPPDRRAVRLELAPAAKSLLAHDPLIDVERMVAAALSPSAQTALSDGLDCLLRNLRQRCGGSDFGVCEECYLFCANGAGDDPAGPHRCGLTGEAISDSETRQICVWSRNTA